MSRTFARLSFVRRLALLAVAIAVLVFGAAWYQNATRSAAEQDALDFVRINGFTSEGYRHNLLSGLLAYLQSGRSAQRPLGTQPVVSAAITRDRMTGNMAEHLVNIRNLEVIILYPSDPNGSGIDFEASSFTAVPSLRDLDLPLSEQDIVSIEDRFPTLTIHVADRPAPASAGE